MVIEKLLQLLVCKVDAELFEAVLFEYFEACNIKHADERRFLSNRARRGPVELSVDSSHKVTKATLVNALCERID